MLKLGVIGMSPGNGHPYSWAAIFNGYNADVMADCPFKVIPEYLAKVDPATMGIDGAKVTHVWTQDRETSEHIAAASRVECVADEMTDLIGSVDAVLLARDDGENHLRMAAPFIDAGVPILIDKPLTDNREDLCELARYLEEGKPIMSCSSLRYCEGLSETSARTGRIVTAHAITGKYWRTYGMHIIEAVLTAMGDGVASVRNVGGENREVVHLEYSDGRQAVLQACKAMHPVLHVAFYGERGCSVMTSLDAYGTFRAMLCAFVEMVRTGRPAIDWRVTVETAKILVAAQMSLHEGGREVALDEVIPAQES